MARRSAILLLMFVVGACHRSSSHLDMSTPVDADMLEAAPSPTEADMAMPLGPSSSDMAMPSDAAPAPTAPLAFAPALGSGTAFNGLWGSAGDGLIAVGNAGLLWRSTDDGAHFTASAAAGSAPLRAVWGTGGGDVWAVGNADVVVHSSDHGASWSAQSVPAAGGDLLAIGGSAGAIVIAGSANILRSVDGGASFAAVSSPMTRGIASAVVGFDHTILLGGQGGEIVRSVDDGATFTSTLVSGLSDVHGLWRDGTTTWAAAAAGFARSDDGGAHWTALPTSNANESWSAIAGRTDELWASSNGGFAHSVDHGASWSHVLTGYIDIGLSAWTMPSGTTFLGADFGALVRVAADDTVTVLATGETLVDASAAPNGELFVVGGHNGGLLHSIDHGATWTVLPMTGAGVWAAKAGELWTTQGASLNRSVDGGKSWTTTDLSGFGNSFTRIWMPRDGEIWIGGHGPLLRSTDGGATFTKLVGDASSYYGPFAGSSDDVWTSIYNGAIHSTDHGATWKQPYVFDGGDSCFGLFVAGNDVWQLGGSGKILHASDGTTFTPQASGTSVGLVGGWARASDDLYVVGENGTILRSSDAGAHWATVPSGTTKTLQTIVSDGNGGALVLGDATLLHGR